MFAQGSIVSLVKHLTTREAKALTTPASFTTCLPTLRWAASRPMPISKPIAPVTPMDTDAIDQTNPGVGQGLCQSL